MKIRAGDTVVVIAGKDKGKTGQVLRVLQEKNRVVVAGVNMRTRHVRAQPNRPGQILHYEAGLSRSNVMLLDPKTKKGTRVGFAIEKGRKVRVARKSGSVIEAGKVSAKTAAPKKSKAKDADTAKKAKPAADNAAPPAKQAFWKRMGFGSDANADAAAEGAVEQKDHTIPRESPTMTRSSGRGS